MDTTPSFKSFCTSCSFSFTSFFWVYSELYLLLSFDYISHLLILDLLDFQVFNFTLGVKVEQHSQPLGKAEQDMTKLCNHRRKVVAMAALCRSMQVSQLPFANLQYSGIFFLGVERFFFDQFVREDSQCFYDF